MPSEKQHTMPGYMCIDAASVLLPSAMTRLVHFPTVESMPASAAPAELKLHVPRRFGCMQNVKPVSGVAADDSGACVLKIRAKMVSRNTS
jgi:hypothetical protein